MYIYFNFKLNVKIFQTKKQNQKDENLVKIQNERDAEVEKFKGNELMKTKEFEEAIKHYNNSIRLNPTEPTTYCNRALALIKTKSSILNSNNYFLKIIFCLSDHKLQNIKELQRIVKVL